MTRTSRNRRTARRNHLAAPGAVLVRVFFAGLLLWFIVPWMTGLVTVSEERWAGPPPAEARAQLRSIQRRLARGHARAMGGVFPEGELFSHSFYGFALVNMALGQPDDAEFAAMARGELQRVIPSVESLARGGPFHTSRNLVPRGGIIPAGHANLLRAGYVILGGSREDIVASFHETSALLFREFAKSGTGSLETFPNMIWPVDNCCALESLRLHDGLYGTDYSAACRRWSAWIADHLDPETGMMVAQVSSTGEVLAGPRGCALSWSLAFMPGFAPDLARSQYERYRETWFIHTAGTTGIREWPAGRRGRSDVDSGPVVGGIGAAASGLGIAAAKVNGDVRNLRGLLRGMELLGAPTWSLNGDKQYFLGLLLLADTLALWGKTARVWDAAPNAPAGRAWSAPDLSGFWKVLVGAGILSAVLLFLVLWSLRRAYRRVRNNADRWAKGNIGVLVFEVLVLLTWLVVPAFSLFYAVMLLAIADIVSNRYVVRASLRKIHGAMARE